MSMTPRVLEALTTPAVAPAPLSLVAPDLPPPPPGLPDQPAASDRTVSVHGSARHRNVVRADVGTGFVLLNEKGESLDAHCEVCGCRVNRKFTAFATAKTVRTCAQGRPMGMLLLFLEQACTGDAAAHRSSIAQFSHADRLAARRRAEADSAFAPLLGMERAVGHHDHDGEPLGLP